MNEQETNIFDDDDINALENLKLFFKERDEKRIKEIQNNFEEHRLNFTWGRNLNKDGEPLNGTQYLKLYEISDEHLHSLIKYVHKYLYDEHIRYSFKKELRYRLDNDIIVPDYDD